MANKFTVQILTDKEFDNLPYKGISDSLGIADKEKGLAFVRETGIKEFDRVTLMHEIDELVNKHSNHEDEFGIRHKKGGVMKSIVPILLGAIAAPFTGGSSLIPALLGTASSIGMNQYAQANHPDQLGKPGQIGDILLQGLGGAASGLGGAGISGAIAGATEGGSAAAPGFLSKAGGIISGAGKGFMQGAGAFAPSPATTGTAGALQGPVTAAQNAMGFTNLSQVPANLLGSTAATAAAKTTGALQGPVTAAQSAQGFTNLSQVPGLGSSLPGINSSITPATKTASVTGLDAPAVPPSAIQKLGDVAPAVNPGTTSAAQPSAMSGISSAIKKLATPQNLLGAGTQLASILTPPPEFQMPDTVEQLRSKLLTGGGLSSLGQQAQTELSGILKSTPQELYPTANNAYYDAALRRTRESYDQAKRNLDASYNLAGVYGSGEHLAAQAKLNQQLTNAESDLYAQTEQRNFELARTAKYQAIQDSLGVDRNTMDDLVGLTGLDVQTAAMVYGAQVADVQAIREALGTIGSEILSRSRPTTGTQGQQGGVM